MTLCRCRDGGGHLDQLGIAHDLHRRDGVENGDIDVTRGQGAHHDVAGEEGSRRRHGLFASKGEWPEVSVAYAPGV